MPNMNISLYPNLIEKYSFQYKKKLLESKTNFHSSYTDKITFFANYALKKYQYFVKDFLEIERYFYVCSKIAR